MSQPMIEQGKGEIEETREENCLETFKMNCVGGTKSKLTAIMYSGVEKKYGSDLEWLIHTGSQSVHAGENCILCFCLLL